MKAALFFLLLFFILLALLSLLPSKWELYACVDLAREQKRYQIQLQLLLWKWKWCLWQVNKELEWQGWDPDSFSWQDLKDLFSFNTDWQRWRQYKKGILRGLAHVRLLSLQWNSRWGSGEAMSTAIGSGSLWALKGVCLSWLARGRTLQQAKIMVWPDYENNGFFSEFRGIFRLRLVHIMITGLYILVVNMRWWLNGYIERKQRQSSHREFDADCHAEH